jgi:hypothetical protein
VEEDSQRPEKMGDGQQIPVAMEERGIHQRWYQIAQSYMVQAEVDQVMKAGRQWVAREALTLDTEQVE